MTGAEPSGAIAAGYFDGLSAVRHAATVAPTEDQRSLQITLEDGQTILWPLDRLRALRDEADRARLTLALRADESDETGRDAARLIVTDPAAMIWFRQHLPNLSARDVRPGTLRKVVLWGGGAVAAVGLMLFVILPAMADYMARHLPLDSEVALGHSVMKQVQWMVSDGSNLDLTCTSPEGLAALEKLQRRLTERAGPASRTSQPITLSVFDHEMVNAFAVPGGQIIIFHGLLDEAESPDEVAGVLAHEIGHVAARDPTRIALRSAGSAGILSLLLGDVSGGTVVAIAGEQLLTASYTRDAEAAADSFGLGLLSDVQVSSEGLAEFFDRIAGETDSMPEIISSHPLSDKRAVIAHSHAEGQGATTPALEDADWQALKAICD